MTYSLPRLSRLVGRLVLSHRGLPLADLLEGVARWPGLAPLGEEQAREHVAAAVSVGILEGVLTAYEAQNGNERCDVVAMAPGWYLRPANERAALLDWTAVP